MTGKKFQLTEAGWRNDRRIAYFCYDLETDEETFSFEETLEFPFPIPESFESERLLGALHIALAISYYKSFIPPIIEHSYGLSDTEAHFWNEVYRNGLGEFLYKNKLDPQVLATFSAQEKVELKVLDKTNGWNDSAMLGIGGGKDSIVAGELLKEIALPIEGFVLATGEELGQTQAVAHVMDVPLHAIKRVVDPKIISVNALEGSYNGHIPISVIFGLVGAMVAVAGKHKYVVVANEASASIPQTEWAGTNVNHQWSKSIEYETLFQEYVQNSISTELTYFSAVRPLSSVAIAKIFSYYPAYFEVFTSDNSLFKITKENRDHPRWSITSSKSLSSFILLAPWIQKEDMLKIFGQDYLDIAALEDLFHALLGQNGQSVLDCVGTPDELNASLQIILSDGAYARAALVLAETSNPDSVSADARDLSSFLTIQEHRIPAEVAARLIERMEKKL